MGGGESDYSVCPRPLLQFLQFFQFMSDRLRRLHQVTSVYVGGMGRGARQLNHFRSGKSRVEFGVKEQYLTEKKLKKKLLSSEWDFPRLKVRSHPDDEKILIRNV